MIVKYDFGLYTSALDLHKLEKKIIKDGYLL